MHFRKEKKRHGKCPRGFKTWDLSLFCALADIYYFGTHNQIAELAETNWEYERAFEEPDVTLQMHSLKMLLKLTFGTYTGGKPIISNILDYNRADAISANKRHRQHLTLLYHFEEIYIRSVCTK